jgi:membrane-associated phospholipid phosphatase
MIKPIMGRARAQRTRSRHTRLVAFLSVSFALCAIHAPAACASDAVETSGDLLALALPSAALGLTIKHHDRDGRRQFYKAFGANIAATWVLKEAIDKKRPNGRGHDAFPSGHSSVAFQSAAFIQRRYGIRSAWPAYLLATYTGWTRIDADQHDETDVLAGAALGIASSFFFAERLPRVNVAATVDHGALGLRVSGHF